MTTPSAKTEPSFKASRLSGLARLDRQRGWARLHGDGGGAAIVEFAMAIMPIFILFFGMLQWSILAYVNLLVQHAANVAARAEAVERPGMPDNGGDTGSGTDLAKAVTPLFVHVKGVGSIAGLGNVIVSIPTQANPCDQTPNTVQVSLYYPCSVPLGNAVVCGGFLSDLSEDVGLGFFYKFTATASFPNQGSYYQAVWKSQIGGAGCSTGGG